MQVVANVATADTYPSAGQSGAELGPDTNALQLIYVVANAAVFAQFRPVQPDGTVAPYGPEVLITPSTNTVTRVAGARFRSAVAGTPARVVAVLLEPDDPQFGGGTPFTGTLAASGGITPGVASVQVEKDGVLIGQEAALNFIGTTWTIADNGALGRIDITPGSSGAWQLIADSVLAAPAASVLFSGIPQTYKHLKLVTSCYQSAAGNNWSVLRVNGLATAIYDGQSMGANAGTFTGGEYANQTFWNWFFGYAGYSAAEALFPDYANTGSLLRGFEGQYTTDWGGHAIGALGRFVGQVGGLVQLGAGITSIQVIAGLTTFIAPSRFSLYGMS